MMMRHLSQISNYNIHVVNENDAKKDPVSCVEKVLMELNPRVDEFSGGIKQAEREL